LAEDRWRRSGEPMPLDAGGSGSRAPNSAFTGERLGVVENTDVQPTARTASSLALGTTSFAARNVVQATVFDATPEIDDPDRRRDGVKLDSFGDATTRLEDLQRRPLVICG
jgi:hypothetical protein